MPSKRILLGQIGAAHGIRGEVMIRTFTGAPQDIAAYGPLSNADETRSFRLTVVRVTEKGVVARITGVTDRTQAETLRGTELYVERHLLPAAADGEFYYADLIGMTAADAEGRVVGEVIAVQNFGGGDMLEIRLAASGKTEFVAFTDDFVPAVDVARGIATVVMSEPAAKDGAPGAAKKRKRGSKAPVDRLEPKGR